MDIKAVQTSPIARAVGTGSPKLFQPKFSQLCNTRMKFQVANREVLNVMVVAHVSVQMYGWVPV